MAQPRTGKRRGFHDENVAKKNLAEYMRTGQFVQGRREKNPHEEKKRGLEDE